MAILDQNYVKFESDVYTLRFIVTDSTNISNYEAWWGLSKATSYATLDTAGYITKASNGWTVASNCPNAGNGSAPTSVGTPGGVTVAASYVDINVEYTLTEDFTPDGGFGSSGLYYYELVLSENGNQCESTVSAQGFLDVRESLFNTNSYRGTY